MPIASLKKTRHSLFILFCLAFASSCLAYQIIDINVVEYVDENNTWNGFCWNCGDSVVGDGNAYGLSQYGRVDAAWGDINFTNTSSSTDLADVVVVLSNVEETFGWSDQNCSDAANIEFWDGNPSEGVIKIHIIEMPKGYSVDCNYSINKDMALTPLVIYENYGFRTVILQQPNPITLFIVNQDPGRFTTLSNIVLYKLAPDTNYNGIRDFNFTNCNADSNGTVTGCGSDSTDRNWFRWSLGSYALNDTNGTKTNPVRMTFTATEADYMDHNYTGFYSMGAINATFDSTGAVTSLQVEDVYGVGPAEMQVYKRQDPDGESTHIYDGYDWGFNMHFKNKTTDVNYNIRKASMWITINDLGQDPRGYLNWHNYRNPNQAIDINELFGGSYMVMPQTGSDANCFWNEDSNHLECTTYPIDLNIGPGEIWYMSSGLDIDSNRWWIDKNLASNPPNTDGNTPWVPVVWGDINFSINEGEHVQHMIIYQNQYALLERVYIIHDYIIEARKTFRRAATDSYDINIYVHNRGSKNTPQTVYVYDVVPSGFDINTAYATNGFSRAPDSNQAIYGDINGMAYWWNVGPLDMNGSPNDHVEFAYKITGSGDYNAIDLFIIGIDPIQSDVFGRTTPRAVINNLRNEIINEEKKVIPGVGAVLVAGLFAGMLFIIRK